MTDVDILRCSSAGTRRRDVMRGPEPVRSICRGDSEADEFVPICGGAALCPGADQEGVWHGRDQYTPTSHLPQFRHVSRRVHGVAHERREINIKTGQSWDVAISVDAAEFLIPVKLSKGDRE